MVGYLRKLENEDPDRRLVVLIAELQPMRPWEWILQNQRGVVLDRAIRQGTANVVICRIRFRAATLSLRYPAAPRPPGSPPRPGAWSGSPPGPGW